MEEILKSEIVEKPKRVTGFCKGNTWAVGHGRKGFEIEREQLAKMQILLDETLEIIKKIYERKADDDDWKILDKTWPIMNKFADKLHANRNLLDVRADILERRQIELSPQAELLLNQLIELEAKAEDKRIENLQRFQPPETVKLLEALKNEAQTTQA